MPAGHMTTVNERHVDVGIIDQVGRRVVAQRGVASVVIARVPAPACPVPAAGTTRLLTVAGRARRSPFGRHRECPLPVDAERVG